ncbi:MAG: pyridoxal phosphate-dependent aminotransferase family protein [Holosporales bacterium]|nr:pyridoxal phosphate-dependent aminotransferase family protein [Holosporales bacterium]
MIRKYEEFIAKSKLESVHRKLSIHPEDYIDFSSNDYLGFSKNADVINAGINASLKYGSGSGGSRLLSGNNELFLAFEELILSDKNTKAALIFNSGFQANSGVLESLTDKKTTVIFDKLNHASMYHGVFTSSAKLVRFNHLDYDHLENILINEKSKQIMICSETVFGMDGDIADVNVLSDLSNKYGTLLYLDEAHATGIYGKNGYGVSTDFNLNPETTVIMGTFSKALGSSGAYVACSKLIQDFLIQKCRSFVYSTALSPFCIGAAMAAWKMLKYTKSVRKKLLEKSENLREKLKRSSLKTTGHGTNIIPILYKDSKSMKEAKEACLKGKLIVSGIAPPTSPTPRIRIALTTKHTDEEIEKLLERITK